MELGRGVGRCRAPRAATDAGHRDFIGWEGHTVVKLTNGQIWQQIEFHYVRRFASRPNARIYHSNAGYKMIVEGIDDVAVGVERTK